MHLLRSLHECNFFKRRTAEASPEGGGGWAGAREARTAAPHRGSLSVYSSSRQVMLTRTCLSWNAKSRLRVGPAKSAAPGWEPYSTAWLGYHGLVVALACKHAASCTAMRMAGDVRCMRRVSHTGGLTGGNRVAAVGFSSMWAFVTVANLLSYIDMWRLNWTWLLPRVFELTGIRDLYYLSEKRFSLVDYG